MVATTDTSEGIVESSSLVLPELLFEQEANDSIRERIRPVIMDWPMKDVEIFIYFAFDDTIFLMQK